MKNNPNAKRIITAITKALYTLSRRAILNLNVLLMLLGLITILLCMPDTQITTAFKETFRISDINAFMENLSDICKNRYLAILALIINARVMGLMISHAVSGNFLGFKLFIYDVICINAVLCILIFLPLSLSTIIFAYCVVYGVSIGCEMFLRLTGAISTVVITDEPCGRAVKVGK